MLISSKACSILEEKIKSSSDDVFCRGLFLSARWFVMSQTCKDGFHLIVLPDQESAEYCAADLYNLIDGDNVFFLPISGNKIERSNYKSSLNVQRTAAIERILAHAKGTYTVVVSYPEALEERLPVFDSLKKASFRIEKGEEFSREQLVHHLLEQGFERTDFVSSPGQFAERGSLVDIFSFSFNFPYRVSFWGDEVEKINVFDCNTQLSKEECDNVTITSNLVSESNSGNEEDNGNICGIIPDESVIWLDSSDMYKDSLFLEWIHSRKKVYLDIPLGEEDVDAVRFNISPQPVFNKNFEFLIDDIRTKVESGYKLVIFGEKASQLERLKSILSQESVVLLPSFVSGKNIHSGFIDEDDKICCYSDHEIFDRFHRVSIRRSVEKAEQLTLNEINSFNIGDYIVHIDHGVGIFGGLVRIRDDFGRMKEVVKLTYKGGDVVFVSVHALHKISRFKSRDGEAPKINKLGSKTWISLKNAAKNQVKDIAKDLIRLYAKRKASKGFAFSPDSYLQEELESSFIYEDTPDQQSATIAVKRDMEDNCPMDRLICGDVGFGKTEIAIRAAFKAVCDGKQVAVLVPTTILALQHYNSFRERLSSFACNVDYISRLRTASEASDIRKRLESGQIDILIGTHKILGSSIRFKDLGLLIIDEEQKFGVSAKEKLRELKENIDTLTLTATPIPRTLQFSLLGARDLSIINTPPQNRIPIQTEIILFDQSEIRSIINYELNRGGQIFFLHNKVEELPSICEILQRLVPDMKICVAHGQMEPKTLENKMLEFIRGDYDMLLCTTIIENGLDIPNANTIIINQAQNIGLSDLHQLRGRVGRSNKRAFCYLIVPPLIGITEDARRRLKAIEEFSDLGSGFNIAMQDLDIRGAGNLLGAQQSGFISDMGFETYQKIISEAMEELGFEGLSDIPSHTGRFVEDCTIETDQQALIPEEYIEITAEKIRIYKQLDSMKSDVAIDTFLSQIQDRFGKVPAEVKNLFDVVKLRNLGSILGFEKIIVKNGMLIAFFVSESRSAYYQSDVFEKVLKKAGEIPGLSLKQTDSRLKIVTRGVDSIEKALFIVKKLQ